MAVQQNKKSPSKRGMHRAHDFLTSPPLAVEPTTGEVHLRHHISPSGYYRGKKGVKTRSEEGLALPHDRTESGAALPFRGAGNASHRDAWKSPGALNAWGAVM